MCTETSEERDILVITADAVKETGQISFMFMINADPDRKINPPMPDRYGYVWIDRRDGGHPYNVFEGGKGLVVGGGFQDGDKPEWEKEMLDNIPTCTLLMDIDLLPWWEELTARHGVKFRRHHVDGILKTS